MKSLIFLVGIFLTASLHAQEYKVSKNSGRLEIREVNHVTVEGHSGSEIIFTTTSPNGDRDDRAKGLRAISSMGLEDNSGIGLSVVIKGEIVEVQQLKKTDGPKIKILVPKGVTVSYTHSSPYGDQIRIQNFQGEVQVSTVHNGVVLHNTNGPLSIKTVHGDIDASFNGAPTASVVLESVHGHVDVAIPPNAKANLTLSSKWGEMLVDPDFKIEPDKTGEFVTYSEKITSKLNGGGSNMTLSSQHDNVYLRKN